MRIILRFSIGITSLFYLTACEETASHEDPTTQNDKRVETTTIGSQPHELDKSIDVISKTDTKLCIRISKGEVAVSDLPTQEATRNSFYLDCALLPFIGTVKVTQVERDTAQIAREKNAAYLFTQDIDPHYIDQDGNALLHIIILSDLKEEDKLTWIKKLVSEAADTNYMNSHGHEALQAAKSYKQPKIYEWLISNGAISKN